MEVHTQLDCPKCGATLELKYTTDVMTHTDTITVNVIFSINCPSCEWSAEVTATNSVSQEELNEIYIIETENGD